MERIVRAYEISCGSEEDVLKLKWPLFTQFQLPVINRGVK